MTLESFAALESALRARTNYELQSPPPGGWGLDRMQRLTRGLGYPERAQPVVHVAGTSGKGTTVSALASCFDAAGLRVGWTTSPHLVDLRERIRIGAGPAPDALWLEAANRVFEIAGELEIEPTYFELVTAMAFEAFRRAKVDVAVVEVGLGGRLDATNVVQPTACVITRIGLDHGRLLGNDEASIAREKAGILKPGVPAIAGPNHPLAQEAIVAHAKEVGADLWLLGREGTVELLEEAGERSCVRIETPLGIHDVETTLSGPPLDNAALALLALASLQQQGVFPPSVKLLDAAKPGLARLRWRGRFDVVGSSPAVVIDGAHDALATQALAQAFTLRFPGKAPVVLLGIANDKATDAVLDLLAPLCAEAVCTAFASPRATDPDVLAAGFETRGLAAAREGGVEEALTLARARARARDVPLLVTGSLYLAGEVLRLLGEDVSRAW